MAHPKPPTRFTERIPFTEWANLHAHLIWIYDGPVEPCWRHGVIASPHLTGWLLREGHVDIRAAGLDLRASAGEWVFPPSGDLWRRFSEDARILSVRFRASWPTGGELFQDGLGVVFPAKDHPELERAARSLERFRAQYFPRAYRFLLDEPATLGEHLQLQALFARWLDAAVAALTAQGLVPSRMGRMDPRLLKAMHILERRMLSAPLAERELAREVGLSVSQFARLFMRQFGVGPRAFFERRRLEHAVAALQSSPQAIKEIAFDLGFSSLPHFSSWFRRHHGISPRQLRLRPARAAEPAIAHDT